MPLLKTADADIWYEIEGRGPSMLLIAGLASDIASWTPVRAAFAERFTVVMADNRGAGRTRAHAGLAGLTVDDMVGDIVQLADHLDLKDCVFIGHSMGAAIAAEAARRRTQRCRKLVLAAAAKPNARTDAAVRSLAEIHRRFNGGAEFYRALFPWLFAPSFFTNEAMMDAAVAASLAYPHSPTSDMFAAQVGAVLSHKGPGAHPEQETLVLAGADDILFTPDECRAAAARMTHARYQALDGAAHSLFWDQPAAATEAIFRFAAA